jgi:hypothetical protein
MTKKFTYSPEAFLVYKALNSPGDLSDSAPMSKIQKEVPILKITGNYKPASAINQIFHKQTGLEVHENFLNMESHKLSALVPEIMIYKLEESGGRTTSKPFYFPNSADYNFGSDGNTLNYDTAFTGQSAVIENFSFKLLGKDLYESSRNFVTADLRIKVDNLSLLFDAKDGFAPLADLFVIRSKDKAKKITGNAGVVSQGAFVGRNSRIAATLGYAIAQSELFTADELKVISKSKVFINLYYAGHDVQVEQDGSATISVSYTGGLESSDKATPYDIITPATTKYRIAKAISNPASKPKEDIKTASKKDGTTASDEDQIPPPSPSQIYESFHEIINTLEKKGLIHRVTFDKGFYNLSLIPAKKEDSQEKESTRAPTSAGLYEKLLKDRIIHYFTVGDFLGAYYKKLLNDMEYVKNKAVKDAKAKIINDTAKNAILKDANQTIGDLKKYHILFANVSFYKNVEIGPEKVKPKSINIADIPISLSVLQQQVYEKYVKTAKNSISWKDMLDEFIPTLIGKSMDKFSGAPLIRKLSVKTMEVSGRRLSMSSPGSFKSGKITASKFPPISQPFSRGDINSMGTYIVYVLDPGSSDPAPGNGNPGVDASNGIFHLYFSKDRGLVKNISFSKISDPVRESYLMVRNGDLYDEVRIPHHAKVSLFGSSMFTPNSRVYINPDTLGYGDPRRSDSAARRLGLGGYYNILYVTTTYSNGQLTTELDLLYDQPPDMTGQPAPDNSAEVAASRDMTNRLAD